jgi:hypothetical protein
VNSAAIPLVYCLVTARLAEEKVSCARSRRSGIKSSAMGNSVLLGWLFRILRRRSLARDLSAAASWPTASAKLLKGEAVVKDELAEGTLAQQYQLECGFYFELPAEFFGGHLRSVPCSESEGRRWSNDIAEGVQVTVRYDPSDPDRAIALAKDNEGSLPFRIWPS